MRLPINLPRDLLFITITFVVLFHDSFGDRQFNLHCGKCMWKETCRIQSPSFLYEVMSMNLIQSNEVWKNKESIGIKHYKADTCTRNKVREIIAFLFSLPTPTKIAGCTMQSDCDSCGAYLLNGSLSQFAHATEKDILRPFRFKILAAITKGIFYDVNITGSNVNPAKFIEENTEESNHYLPKRDERCPKQMQYPTVLRNNLLYDLLQSTLGCFQSEFRMDPVSSIEMSRTTFLHRVLLVSIDGILNFIRKVEARQFTVPDLSKSICEDYNDKYYVAKHRAIRSILKHTLGCRQCPEYSSSDNIRNWFRFGANAISTLPLTSPNSTSTASDSEPYSAEALSLQSCPYLFENLEHEGLASIVTGIKNVLDDVLDCRLKFCKYISQESIQTHYFRILYHYGCVSCIQDEFCKGQSGVECVRKFIPSFRTPLHAVKDIASSIMQCDFEMNEFLPLQFERSLSRIHKFHQVLYGLSIMVSKLNMTTPECSTDCDRTNGPSLACDICDAIYTAKTISELTRKVLNCTETFTIGGEKFCMAEAVVAIARSCPVNYTSFVQYSAIAKEIHALAFAIRALAGCPAAETKPFNNDKVRCAFLRSALNLSSTIIPEISFPEQWLNTIAFSPSILVRSFLENLLSTSQCNSLCHPWQQYCASSRSCWPAYLNCTPVDPVPANETFLSIGHVAIDKLGSTLFPVSDFANETILIEGNLTESHLGKWDALFPNEARTSHVTDDHHFAVIVGKTFHLKYTSKQHNSYGARLLHFFVPSSNSAFDVSKYAVGHQIHESLYSMLNRRTAVLFIHPVARPGNLRLIKHPKLKTVIGNNNTIYFPPINHYIGIDAEFKNHDIPRSLYPYLNKDEVDLFYQSKAAYKMMQPVAVVVSISPNGTWYIKNTDQRSRKDLTRLSPNANFPIFDTDLSYIPQSGYYGLVSLHLNVCYCHLRHLRQHIDRPIPIVLRINIKAKNKQPIALVKYVNFPPIAYNTSLNPNDGFYVSALRRYGSDVETPILGIVVFGVLPSKYGKWYYKLKGRNWTELRQGKPVNVGSKNAAIAVVRLKPTDKIKFGLENEQSFWSLSDAKKRVRLHFMFWDMSDNKTHGPHLVKMNEADASAYSSDVVGYMLRKGCDGQAGSMLKIDACGVCGGKGECVACDGVPFSNASYDDCGQCTGGYTWKKRNYLQDCANTCGKSFEDECGICQAKGNRRNFTDCSGTCFGQAKWNKCGRCYGGSTGLTESVGEDECGVCGGTGSSCSGCDGVPNSGKVSDKCGICLHPSNASFNTNCLKIYSFTPRSSPVTGGREILVEGAGLNRYNKARCQFKRNNPSLVLNAREVTIDAESKGKFKITTPPADAGTYEMECLFDTSTTAIEHPTDKSITFYNTSFINITDLYPRVLGLGDREIEIRGTGLSQTGSMQCAYMINRKVFLNELNGQMPSCQLPKLVKSAKIRMTVVASLEDGILSELDKLPETAWRSLTVYASAPSPLSARLSSTLDSIVISFSKKIASGKKMCHEMFAGDVDNMFGYQAKCFIKGRTAIEIALGSNPIIQIGQTIQIKSPVFFAYNEQYSHPAVGSVQLIGPSADAKPVVTLFGPSEVGACDGFSFKALVLGNTGGRTVSFSWTVSFARDVDQDMLSLEDQADIKKVTGQLASETGFRIRINPGSLKPTTSQKYIAYEISVTASNFLNHKASSSMVVQRSSTNAPSIQIVGDKKQRIRANKDFLINARVKLSACQSSKELMLYEWKVSPTVDLGVQPQKNPRLFIRRRTLTPGITYTFTLTVSSTVDPSISSTASVDLAVDISDLVLSPKGSFYETIGSDMDITLDASSRDPDRTTETEKFIWECMDSSHRPCFIPDPHNTDRITRLILPQARKVTIERGKLAPNQTYTFTLTYKKGSRSSSMIKQVYIIPGSPPIVKIRPLRTKKVNVQNKVVLKGYVELTTSSSTDVWWECIADEDYNFVDISDPEVTVSKARYTISRSGTSMVVLIIKGNVLDKGAMYRFRLSAQNSDGLGYADSAFIVNGPPSVGRFYSDISSGTALESLFILQALEGWTDDEEDLPLTYKFGYVNKRRKDCFFGSGSLDNEIEVILPIGFQHDNRLEVFVDVSDNKGAVRRQFYNVVVRPMSNFSLSTIDDLAGKVQATLETNDISAILGRLSSTLNVFNMASESASSVTGISSEMLAGIANFKEKTSAAFVSMLESVPEVDSKNLVLDALPDLTTGGISYSGELRENISQLTAKFIMSQMPLQSSPQSPQPVTFSLLDSDDIDVDIGKSPEEVERIIQIYQNILNASMYDDTNMKVKRDFTGLLNSLLASMCAKSMFGEDAALAFTEISVMQSFKYNLGGTGAMNLSIGKRNWRRTSFIPSMVNLGNELSSKYSDWQCTDEYRCSGICVGSVQFPKDLFSDGVFRDNITMISPTIRLNLFNPETNVLLTENQLSSPITILIPTDMSKHRSNHTKQCNTWDEATHSWRNDSCMAEKELAKSGNDTFVVCKCLRTGTIAAFQRPIVEQLSTGGGGGSKGGGDGSGTGGGAGGTGGTGVTNWGASSGNITRNNPLLTLFVMIGILSLSCSLGFGFFGYEKYKANVQLTPRNN